eukprot:15475260-Alexandrium_andersonii.AAC.1
MPTLSLRARARRARVATRPPARVGLAATGEKDLASRRRIGAAHGRPSARLSPRARQRRRRPRLQKCGFGARRAG